MKKNVRTSIQEGEGGNELVESKMENLGLIFDKSRVIVSKQEEATQSASEYLQEYIDLIRRE